MTEEYIIELADNGMTAKGDEYFEVYEDNYMNNSYSKDNVYSKLGKLFYSSIKSAMDELIKTKVKVKIEITEADD